MAEERDMLAAPGVGTQVVDGRVGQEDDRQGGHVLFQGSDDLVGGEGGIPANVDQNADAAIELEQGGSGGGGRRAGAEEGGEGEHGGVGSSRALSMVDHHFGTEVKLAVQSGRFNPYLEVSSFLSRLHMFQSTAEVTRERASTCDQSALGFRQIARGLCVSLKLHVHCIVQQRETSFLTEPMHIEPSLFFASIQADRKRPFGRLFTACEIGWK